MTARLAALKLFSSFNKRWMQMRGVKVGAGGWILGRPELFLRRGSVVEIGDNVTLTSLSRFNPLAPSRRVSLVTYDSKARIQIGNGAGISASVISASASVSIGERTLIGAECIIADSDFHGLPVGTGAAIRMAPIEIGRQVFVGTRCIILKGVKIGDHSIIGAGSIVTSDVPANCVAAGNPARVLRTFA